MAGLKTTWATAADVEAHCATDPAVDPTVLTEALWDASYLLFLLTRGRWNGGGASDTVRPTAERATAYGRAFGRPSNLIRVGDGSYFVTGATGQGWGFCSCDRFRQPGCNAIAERWLPGRHVTAITSVTLDGAPVPATNFEVHDWQWLVGVTNAATGVQQWWPCCQDVTKPLTAVNTFGITYVYGRKPPTAWRHAAAELGYEIALYRTPACAAKCKLSGRVVAATRQGVSYQLRNPDTGNVETGIRSVDTLLAALRWQDTNRPAAVVTPGQRNRVRRVTLPRSA